MENCPHCGDDGGVYRTYTGVQYYFWDGEPSGFNADVPDNQSTFARCIRCNRKISMRRIWREAEESPKNLKTEPKEEQAWLI